MKIISHFFNIPGEHRLIALEAFVLMGLARFSILFIPFRRLASIMGRPMIEADEEINPELLNIAKKITWLINKISYHTPWESKCFVKALTALIMLKRRRIPCTLYFGMAKSKNETLLAHAWLRCGHLILLGEKERLVFTTVAYFST